MYKPSKYSEGWQEVLDNPIEGFKARPIHDTFSSEGRPNVVETPPDMGSSIKPHTSEPYEGETPALKTMVYPPGHSEKTFILVLEGLAQIVGKDWLLLNTGELHDGDYYVPPLSHDSFHIFERHDFVPSCVVQPESTEQVSQIVKLANKYKFPLWSISIGRNLGYGGSAPRVRGSVLVDLGKRMNRVLHVDEEEASCLIEPGVKYVDLYNHIAKIGLKDKLAIDVPDVGGGSVVGNMLDRGRGYSEMGDHFGSTCGMEVVLPNGEIMRTGMGAIQNGKSWQSHKYGIGPYMDGAFTQSNYGIVTKVGFHLYCNPGGCRTFMVGFAKDTDLEAIIETTRPLVLKRLIHGVPSIRTCMSDVAIYSQRSDFVQGFEIASEEVRDYVASKLGGRWILYGCWYGPPEVTERLYQICKREYEKIPGAKIYLQEELPDWHYIHDRAKVFAGIPHFRELNQLKAFPKVGACFFAPICPNRHKDVRYQVDLVREVMWKHGFDDNGTFYLNSRDAHHLVGINYHREMPETKKKALELVRELIARSSAEGYGEYRTHLVLYDQVQQTFNFNGNVQQRFFEQIKDAIDPNGVLSPGRYAIWPKDYRGKGWELQGGETASDPALRALS